MDDPGLVGMARFTVVLPIIASFLCLFYLVIMLIASIPGGDCLGGYMLIAAVSFPWLWFAEIRGLILYLLFFANAMMLVAIAGIVGALMDVFLNRRALREKLKRSTSNRFLLWLLEDLRFPRRS